ncbi:MAG TPA: tRNA (adenosine(37)-N6)-threonylcarbamoyltransferase complex dimerization subunit type 1 TsaB [Gemmatimonadaceae bacterium]|nr:tRNA (adenosine(37)-N6)-threonylcarbamoyltransferase complex dimerization subunit type 1 TsaB [Gemmatimonadaceae bacterium]
MMSRANGTTADDALTLVLEAATSEGSVAVFRGGLVVADRTVAMRDAHEDRLMPAVVAALGDAGARARDVARIVCGAGPGSFTSLRIAASIAKGVATVARMPVYAVSSLTLAAAEHANATSDGRIVVALDALRGEVFVAAFEVHSGSLVELRAPAMLTVAAADEFAASLGTARVNAKPHARAAARVLDEILATSPIDLATWEPAYGRKAEAQVRWEAAHGRPLTA